MAITNHFRPTAAVGEVWMNGWQSANLLKPSAIKPVFGNLEKALIMRTLGKLTKNDQSALRSAMNSVLG